MPGQDVWGGEAGRLQALGSMRMTRSEMESRGVGSRGDDLE